MTRPYSDKFLRALALETNKSLGQQLGEACVKANLPAAYVSTLLNCSRMTVYSWFRSKGVSEAKRPLVEALIKIINEDLAAGLLPVKTNKEAKLYIEGLLKTN